MRKLLVVLFAVTASVTAFSQSTETKKPKKKYDIVSRAGDHFMVQLAQNVWNGAPDSINNLTKSLNRSGNVYLMLNKPFKADPRLSIGFGLGIGTSNMYFKNALVNISATTPLLAFVKADSINHFKKYKLSSTYLQVPIEFRFTADPSNPNKSLKAAIGIKVETLIAAHTKGRTLVTPSGSTINSYTEKTSNKTYFNSTGVAATARFGYGVFSLFGSYNLTPVFKDGVASDIKLLQVGLTVSGL